MKRKLLSLLLVLVLCLGMAIPSMAASAQAWESNLNVPHHFVTNFLEWTNDATGDITTTYLFIHTDMDGTAKVSLKKDLKFGEVGAAPVYAVEFTEDGQIHVAENVEIKDDIKFDPSTMICKKGGKYYLKPGKYLFDAESADDVIFIEVVDINDFGKNPFKDVGVNDYFYAPVLWAAEEGITTGTTTTTFSPNETCTQGQILTFLWRAVGEPNASIDDPFTNEAVNENMYFYNALLWAYKDGVIDDAGIDPNAPCKRSDVALYLWRLAESPEMGTSQFTDVPADAEYADAVAWAVEWGITKGTSETTFSPDATCTRGQIVTFLCRSVF